MPAKETADDKIKKLIDAVNNIASQVNNMSAVLSQATTAINRLTKQQAELAKAVAELTNPSPETPLEHADARPSALSKKSPRSHKPAPLPQKKV